MHLRNLRPRLTKIRIVMTDPETWLDGVKCLDGRHVYYDTVSTLAEADGFWFDCPCTKCDGKPYSTRVLIGFEGRCPPNTYSKGSDGNDTRWNIVGGTGLDDLQLAPSIQIIGACEWHGFVGSNGVPPGEAQ